MENEILAAEIYLHPVGVQDATKEIDEQLEDVERALKSYSVDLSMLDYAAAVISGLLSGAIDAVCVKETELFSNDALPSQEKVKDTIKKVFFNNYAHDKVTKPVMHHPVSKGIPAMFPPLEEFAKRPTPIGLAAAVLLQAGRGGMFSENNNKLHIFPEGMSRDDCVIIATVAVIVGLMKWLDTISEKNEEAGEDPIKLNTLHKVCDLIQNAPAFSIIVAEFEKWQRQLPNEIKCGKSKANKNAGVEQTFFSFFTMLAAIPTFEGSNLRKTMDKLLEGKRLGLNEIPILQRLNKQALPVLLNEIIVRSFYFVTRLVRQLEAVDDVNNTQWDEVLPFGNRNIDRMLAISSMTLSVADTTDAAIHAAIDSCGETTMFAKKFTVRFNYLAVGRAAIAVVKDINAEKQQEQLIHMKRLLTEAKTAKALEILLSYQDQLDARVSEYLAEDISTFIEGFDFMDQGLTTKDSDLVIKGNVMLQRVLGREPQFTNQKEFDDLMDSDMPLIL